MVENVDRPRSTHSAERVTAIAEHIIDEYAVPKESIAELVSAVREDERSLNND